MAGSIGSIFVDFQARTAGLDSGTRDAAATVRGFAGQVGPLNSAFADFGSKAEGVMLKVGTQLLFGRSLVFFLASEFRNVAKNIDDIPDLPSGIRSGVKELTWELQGANSGLQRMAATLMGWTGTGIEGWEQIVDYFKATVFLLKTGGDVDKYMAEQAVERQKKINEQWQHTPEYIAQVTAARERLNEATTKSGLAGKSPGEKADWEMADAAVKRRNAQAGALDELEAVKQLTKAQEEENTAIDTHRTLMQEYYSSVTRAKEAAQKLDDVHVKYTDTLARLQKQQKAILEETEPLTKDSSNSEIEHQVELLREYARVLTQTAEIQNKVREGSLMMTQAIVGQLQNIAGAITNWASGTKDAFRNWAKQAVQSILDEFLKLELLNPILNGLFGGVKGFQSLPVMGGLGALISGFLASGGPASMGQAYVVGEQGPEVFVPGVSGTVVPNGAGGGDTFHQNFNFNSGVSRQELAALLPMVAAAAQSGVADRARRGGPYAMALGTS